MMIFGDISLHLMTWNVFQFSMVTFDDTSWHVMMWSIWFREVHTLSIRVQHSQHRYCGRKLEFSLKLVAMGSTLAAQGPLATFFHPLSIPNWYSHGHVLILLIWVVKPMQQTQIGFATSFLQSVKRLQCWQYFPGSATCPFIGLRKISYHGNWPG